MKKTLKIAVSMALALMMLITPSLAIIAPEDAVPNFSAALDEYFSVRAETLVSPQNRTRSLSNKFSSLEATRAQNFAAVDENIEIVDALAEYAIVSSEINGNVAVVDVYEWSWLEYYADDTVTTTNNMGFGTEHRITLNKINGEWVIVNDKYDESDITGVSTLAADETLVLNYDRSLLNEVYAKTVGVEKLEQQETEIAQAKESGVMIASANANQRSTSDSTSIAANYNPYAAIEYADRWVGIGYASDNNPGSPYEMMIPSNYNSEFLTYPQDCINFVSQCLYAGGLEMVWGNQVASSDNEWWYDFRKTDLWTASPNPWRHTYFFDYFWKHYDHGEFNREDDQGEFSVVNATESTVYPGNPVYYVRSMSDGGHGAFCVGYNAAGNTIYNAHNRDVYHVTMQYISDSRYTLKTVQFVNETTLNYPNTAYDFGTVGETTSYGIGISNGNSVYLKFTVATDGVYSVYSEKYSTQPQLDTYAYLYEESRVVQAVIEEETVTRTLHMVKIAENDDYDIETGDFGISMYLTAGTYYIQVRPYYYEDSGYTYVYVVNGGLNN